MTKNSQLFSRYAITTCIILAFVSASLSQNYYISRPPINGYCYGDSIGINRFKGDPLKGIEIYSDSNIAYSLEEGKVLNCYKTGNSYSVIVRCKLFTVVYAHLAVVYVQKNQRVTRNAIIGKLAPNKYKKDKNSKKYMLCLNIEASGKTLWDYEIVRFLHAEKME